MIYGSTVSSNKNLNIIPSGQNKNQTNTNGSATMTNVSLALSGSTVSNNPNGMNANYANKNSSAILINGSTLSSNYNQLSTVKNSVQPNKSALNGTVQTSVNIINTNIK